MTTVTAPGTPPPRGRLVHLPVRVMLSRMRVAGVRPADPPSLPGSVLGVVPGAGHAGGRSPAIVTATRRRTAACDERPPAAARACRQ
jgi:hypothetical protein